MSALLLHSSSVMALGQQCDSQCCVSLGCGSDSGSRAAAVGTWLGAVLQEGLLPKAAACRNAC